MQSAGWTALLLASLVWLGACTLVTDLDGLTSDTPATAGAGGGTGGSAGAGGAATGPGGGGGASSCTVVEDCSEPAPCRQPTCIGGTCGSEPIDEGLLARDDALGDCLRRECDGAGNVVVIYDDADLPDDDNECTVDGCNSGSPSFDLQATGTPCGANDTQICGAQGTCVGCVADIDCGSPLASDCIEQRCDTSGNCSLELQSGPVLLQTSADCERNECDGMGNLVTVPYDADLPDDQNQCTVDSCDQGTASNVAVPNAPIVSCGTGGVGTCVDGGCIPCGDASDCPGTDNACRTKVCDPVTGCGWNFLAVGTELPALDIANDCVKSVCGNFGTIDTVADPSDLPVDDGFDCTAQVCDGLEAKTVPSATGTPCGSGAGAGICSGTGVCITCIGDGDCTPSGPCKMAACNAGACVESDLPDGTVAAANVQIAGDCKVLRCQGGSAVEEGDDGDVPDDGNECTLDRCVAGAPSNSERVAEAPCSASPGWVCNGDAAAPACVQCATNAQCDSGDICNTDSWVCESCQPQSCAQLGRTCGSIPDGCSTLLDCSGAQDGEESDIDCGGDPAACAQRCANGQSCALDSDCASAHCADGVCCDRACSDACESCDGASPGSCAIHAAATDPDAECGSGQTCDGSNSCKAIDGENCTDDGQCLSGHCVDGFCCDSACDGTCEACDVSVGTCAFHAADQDPDAECGADATCDGAGACKEVDGTNCATAAECASGFCIDGFCCDTACNLTCQSCAAASNGGSNGVCGNTTAGLDPRADCAAGQTCTGGGTCAKANGQGCGAGGECASGLCVDGFCCDSVCGGVCESCAASQNGSTDGSCLAIPEPDDPDNECGGFTTCNGQGACALRSLGTTCIVSNECASSMCADGVCCESNCTGTCRDCSITGDGSCGFIPEGIASPDCNVDEACDGAGQCNSGTGETCASEADCLPSLFCNDSTCCDTLCDQPCRSCNTANTGGPNGQCQPIANGADPNNDCPGETVCDGTGNCRTLEAGENCTQDVYCESGFCRDGVCCDTTCGADCQACVQAKTGSCNDGECCPVAMGTDPDLDCPAGEACSGGPFCRTVDGESCSMDSDCISNMCADGVCCDDPCSLNCESCLGAVTGLSDGVCGLAQDGYDPRDMCGAQACLLGGCVDLPDGTPCPEGDGCLNGNCVEGVCCDGPCGAQCESCLASYNGDSDGACGFITSGLDPYDECLSPPVCDGAGACDVGQFGDPCGGGSDCAGGFCVDGVCCDSDCAGNCQSCLADFTGGSDGMCGAVLPGLDPRADCGAPQDCDGVGGCKDTLGTVCSGGTTCATGNCVDGVCCSGTCVGQCIACEISLTGAPSGSCTPIPAGQHDPGDPCLMECTGAGDCEGTVCTMDAECVSGFCRDGFCCDSDCNGTCESCSALDTGGSPGVCAPVTAGIDPKPDCGPGNVCDGSGTCAKDLGESCGASGECASDFCRDGVCCDSDCGATCFACLAALTGGSDGSCAPKAALQGDVGCSANQLCDGAGNCKLDLGQPCTLGTQCASSQCALEDGVCCDSACDGECQSCDGAKTAGFTGFCGFVTIATDPDTECAAGELCDGAGACKKNLGETCGADGECRSNNCIDTVCCNSPCGGLCESCVSVDTGGSDGSCDFVTGGTDPANECSGMQTCNGAGVCMM
jgi:hypothetical protein